MPRHGAITEASTAADYDPDEAAGINDALRAAGDQVADWGARSSAAPERYLDPDGIHPTPAGSELFAELVREGVDACLDRAP